MGHIIEAECGNCGEHYNPESLEKGYVEHYECGPELGKPRQVWIYDITETGELVMKRVVPKKKFRVKWGEVLAMLGMCAAAVWLVWMFLG